MKKKLLSSVLILSMVFSLASCGKKGDKITEFTGTYTARYYTASLSASWNPLTYQDSFAGDMNGYLSCGFYQFVFNDELHPVDGKDPYSAYTIIPEMAVGEPVDVTAKVKEEHPDWIPETADSGYAWAINLRDDLVFSNGHEIKAQTFVDSVKLLLDPKLLNYRATDFYSGAYGIVGAEAYANDLAGQRVLEDNGLQLVPIESMVKNSDGTYSTAEGYPVFIAVDSALEWTSGNTLKDYVEAYGEAYFGLETWDDLVAQMDEDGLVPCTDENLALLSGVTTTNPAWNESDDELLNYLKYVTGQYPDELIFEDTVGFYASDEYQLTVVYKSSLNGFYLYYNGGLTGNFYLVDPEYYQSTLKETQTANGSVWDSTYMTSAETSPSFGPYIMTEFQTDKLVHYSKNESWFGYKDDNHVYKDPTDGNTYRMYQTTDVEYEVVGEDATQKLMFLSGDFTTYGLKAEDFDQYRNSDYAFASPSATVYFMIVNGNLSAIQAREAAADFDKSKADLETMTLPSFRSALAVSFDRDAFAAAVMPRCTPGYGIFGSAQIYDPDTCAFYRDTVQAKQVLCDYYSVDVSEFASLDEAVASITGYDPETAKELYTQAFNDSIKAGYITDNDGDGISDQTITMYYSTDSESDLLTKTLAYMNDTIGQLTVGTPFEGKIKFESSPILEEWAEPLRNGEYDFALAGWVGSLLDPFSLMDVYVNPGYAYDAKWFDASTVSMTLTLNGESITMSLRQWSDALNGSDITVGGKTYNYGTNSADMDTRLEILAALEGEFLKTGDYLPLFNNGTVLLLSQKVYYVIEDYNPVLGRGGIAYMKYNYDDTAWAEYVEKQVAEHGQLQY